MVSTLCLSCTVSLDLQMDPGWYLLLLFSIALALFFNAPCFHVLFWFLPISRLCGAMALTAV